MSAGDDPWEEGRRIERRCLRLIAALALLSIVLAVLALVGGRP